MQRFDPDQLCVPGGHFIAGGYGRSGLGKDLGRQAVEANPRVKSVLIDFAVPA